MRSIIARTPLERCGVRCSLEAEFAEEADASDSGFARAGRSDRAPGRSPAGRARDANRCRRGNRSTLLSGLVDARLAELEPHLADAAANLVGVVVRRLAQRLQGAAEFEDIAIAVLPVVEEGKIAADRVRVCRGPSFAFASPNILGCARQAPDRARREFRRPTWPAGRATGASGRCAAALGLSLRQCQRYAAGTPIPETLAKLLRLMIAQRP